MNLIETWREIPIPARKTEYEHKHLHLRADPDRYRRPEEFGRYDVDLTDTIVLLTRRCNAKDTMYSPIDVSHWGAIRVLRIRWYCRHCGSAHECYIPEAWLEEGKAVFVERITSEEE